MQADVLKRFQRHLERIERLLVANHYCLENEPRRAIYVFQLVQITRRPNSKAIWVSFRDYQPLFANEASPK
jgi:hypothetical protein